jgi:Flp pilus assembly protein TadB
MNAVSLLFVLLLLQLAWRCRPDARRTRAARLRAAMPTSVSATRRRERPRARARRDRIEATLPDAIELVVLAVRAGALPSVAVAIAARHLESPIGPAFVEVQRAASSGVRFADAIAALPRMLGPPATALADSLAAADRDGLPLAPVLDRLADEARQQRRRHADAMARQLPVRLSLPLVLCTLPAFVLLAVAPLLLAALSSLHH